MGSEMCIRDSLINLSKIKWNADSESDSEDDDKSKLDALVPELVQNKARYHVFPTNEGMEFLANYFEGRDIE